MRIKFTRTEFFTPGGSVGTGVGVSVGLGVSEGVSVARWVAVWVMVGEIASEAVLVVVETTVTICPCPHADKPSEKTKNRIMKAFGWNFIARSYELRKK